MNFNLATKEDLMDLKRELIELLGEKKESTRSQWLRSRDVCTMFGISSGTLQNLRANGNIPFTRLGTTMVYDLDKINQVLNSSDNVDS
jgi:hypothetical protein